ncbi:hypothetical protein [Paenibacillus sp. MMS20-IR301]|uniref:hypothetical protein n=1 Tax=Paenibacillus sp. MMS20-IR301 TaxID=2895946 RepID=UPI0028E7CC4F|nr:hypothetical protein [Paenibacillus sp. MMS20-IR301]WNS45144.1 hypothetical protein LOS79_07705 [Paenibacillus sp. MMS20-IR301]
MMAARNGRYRRIALALVLLIVGAAVWTFAVRLQSAGKQNESVQEYIAGAPGIKGSVDTAQWGDNPAYAIGADRKGYAVFKDPDQAFARMKIDYAKGLKAIREEFGLRAVSLANYQQYGTYGWQITKTEDAEAAEQARRVTAFMDIFENSYVK